MQPHLCSQQARIVLLFLELFLFVKLELPILIVIETIQYQMVSRTFDINYYIISHAATYDWSTAHAICRQTLNYAVEFILSLLLLVLFSLLHTFQCIFWIVKPLWLYATCTVYCIFMSIEPIYIISLLTSTVNQEACHFVPFCASKQYDKTCPWIIWGIYRKRTGQGRTENIKSW